MGDQNNSSKSNTPNATARLNQVSSHLTSSSDPNPNSNKPTTTPKSTSRKSRKSRKSATAAVDPLHDVAPPPPPLPADYSDILSQVATLRRMAATPNAESRGYRRQRRAGKLWVRERVLALVDEGSFREVGSVSGTVEWRTLDGGEREEPVSFTPSNNVLGFAKLKGRKIILTVDDFTIRAGHADGAMHLKTHHMEELSLSMKLPNIKLVDGSSGGGSVTTIKKAGWSYLPLIPTLHTVSAQLNSGIPNLGAIVGPAIGLGAARVTACHFSVMTGSKIGSLFNAGPSVVAGATFEQGLSLDDLGGPAIHCTNGTIDALAPDEPAAFAILAAVLSYLPNHGLELPPRSNADSSKDDDPSERRCPELRTLIPRRRERMYNARRIIEVAADRGSWFEIGALWGRTAIVGLARFGGYAVGIISLDPEVNAGAIDALGSQKVTRHLKFCDVFNLPVVQFIDIPGYAVGTVAEKSATMRHGINLAMTYHGTTMPIANIVTRRCYGVAGGVMLGARNPGYKVSWPSGEWGSLPLDGGIAVGHSYELTKLGMEDVDKAKARYKELEIDYKRLMNPVRTANNFGIEEIIDPADTRSIIYAWVEHVYTVLLPQRLIERSTGKISPVFY